MPYSDLWKREIPTLDARITAAVERITNGHGGMRIPADPTDPDVVLVDCRAEIAALREQLAALRPAGRTNVYAFIDRERRYQDAKFGGRPHEIPSWLMLARSEIAEAEVAWCRADRDEESARAEVVQAAAVLIALLEQHGPAEEPKHTALLAGLDSKCPKCDGGGFVIIADVPGEGRICGGRCPCGAKFGG